MKFRLLGEQPLRAKGFQYDRNAMTWTPEDAPATTDSQSRSSCLAASIHSQVCYLCLRTQSQAIATVTFCQGTSRRETAPDRRKSRRCVDLHGRRQPIYRNRCCSARVSDVRDHLCIFQCFCACRCVAVRERGAINLVSDFGRGCLRRQLHQPRPSRKRADCKARDYAVSIVVVDRGAQRCPPLEDASQPLRGALQP